MIIASEADKRIKCKSSFNLAEGFKNGAQVVLMKDLDHGTIRNDSEVLEIVSERVMSL